MKIDVNLNPVVTATIDMNDFESHFKKHFVLEDAVKKNLKIILNKDFSDEIASSIIYEGIDWGNIFDLYHSNKRAEMKVYVCKTSIDGLKTYKPKENKIVMYSQPSTSSPKDTNVIKWK